MAYALEIDPRLRKQLRKLAKRDKVTHPRALNKVSELLDNPEIGKPLENIMKGCRRVHVGHFVLIYRINEQNRSVELLGFEHHDDAYF
jgi:addiction module RelE/StbE family toxin